MAGKKSESMVRVLLCSCLIACGFQIISADDQLCPHPRYGPPDVHARAPFRWELQRHPAGPVLRAQPGTWEAAWFTVESVLRVDDVIHVTAVG